MVGIFYADKREDDDDEVVWVSALQMVVPEKGEGKEKASKKEDCTRGGPYNQEKETAEETRS
jgi:hypothetical protein